MGEADSVAVLPQRCVAVLPPLCVAVLPPRCVAVLPLRSGPLILGLIPGPGSVCPFGFQSKLASAGFSPGIPVFLLHLKLGFVNKSISGNIVWSYSASADWLLI